MKFVVVVADSMDESGLDELRSADNFEVVSTAKDPDRLLAELKRADALLVRSATTVTASMMSKAPRLKVIGRAGIGVDNIDIDAATRRGIAVLNAPGANTVSAAEHTFALLLSLVRRIPGAVQSMHAGEWNRSQFSGTELRGKTLGLVGLGRIGVHVVGIARAFGMKAIGYDPYLAKSRAAELRVALVSVDELFSDADVITFHAPLTDGTRHILNKERIRLLKPTAVVINTARGALIDTDALADALSEGKIAGAALDVFDTEPLDEHSSLRNTNRLILTPHLAASTNEAQERVACEIAVATRRALETGEVGGAVNVPGVNNEMLSRARVPMELARRLGRLAGYAAGPSAPSAVEVSFGGEHDEVARPVMLAAVEGVLQSMAIAPVSLINATVVAEERNIALSRRINRSVSGFQMSIEVKLQVDGRAVRVVGVPVPGTPGRIVRIDEFVVDIPSEGCIVVLRNRDVPGVVGRVGTLLGDSGVNIGYYHQSRSNASGQALAAIAVDQKPSQQVLDRLREVEDVEGVWCAVLDESARSD